VDTPVAWEQCFAGWPDKVRRRGLIATSFGEQIPFSGFKIGSGLLLLERTTPDTVGSRMVVVSYEQIVALKITDPLDERAVEGFGFVEKMTR